MGARGGRLKEVLERSGELAAGDEASGMRQRVEKIREKTTDYVQRNPYRALAIAVGIGFVAGLIFKRR